MDNAARSEPEIRFLDPQTPPHVFTLILLAGMSALVMNIFLPSLPRMAAYFDTTYAVMQLSVPLYLFFSAILQLFIGPLSDNLGRRPVLITALVLFMVATVGCIFAPNASAMWMIGISTCAET